MVKIEVTTTLRNEQYLNGLATSGGVYTVPEDYAQELVEEKGFAQYVEDQDELVEIKGNQYPKGFLETEIPEDFPNNRVNKALKDEGLETFGDILRYDDPTEIKGIGEDFASILSESILKARDLYQNKS